MLVFMTFALSFSDVFLFESAFLSMAVSEAVVTRELLLNSMVPPGLDDAPEYGTMALSISTISESIVTNEPPNLVPALPKQKPATQARKGNFKMYVESKMERSTPLTEFVSGKAAPFLSPVDNTTLVFPMANATQAVCEFIPSAPFADHFPHTMQQLYRCFSWWQANPRQQRVLMMKTIPPGFVEQYIAAIQRTFRVKVDSTDELQNISVHFPVQGNGEHKKTPFEMRSPSDAAILRNRIRTQYNLGDEQGGRTDEAGCPAATWKQGRQIIMKRLPVIGVLNRIETRRFDNYEEVINAVQAKFDSPVNGNSNIIQHSGTTTAPAKTNLTIHYMDSFNEKSFLEQIAFMGKVDILIGPHGAQLATEPFQPTCGGLLELFPKGYYVPEFYGSLARSTGHYHYALYTGDNQNREVAFWSGGSPERRALARKFHVRADPSLVVAAVLQLVERWQSCCRHQQHQEEQ